MDVMLLMPIQVASRYMSARNTLETSPISATLKDAMLLTLRQAISRTTSDPSTQGRGPISANMLGARQPFSSHLKVLPVKLQR